MAVNAATVWEVRTTGAVTNGGGFADLDPGTSVDYSQQDTAQLALTDLASDGAGTGITSATGGFTAAMVGNTIYITGGTGFTEGYYQITAYTDTNTITIDRSASASKTGGTGNVGGAYQIVGGTEGDNIFFNNTNKASGNTIHVKAGSYTVASQLNATMIQVDVIGYNTTRGDEPRGTDMPLLSQASGVITSSGSGNHWLYLKINNTAGTSSGAISISGTGGSGVANCHVQKEWVNSSSIAVALSGSDAFCIGCDVESYGIGVSIGGLTQTVAFNYINGTTYSATGNGISYSGTNGKYFNVYGNVVRDHAIGINVYTQGRVQNNTIYNVTTGIDAGIATLVVLNNIVHTATTGFQLSANDFADYNCAYNCTTAFAAAMVDYGHNLTSDPLLTDPANGDFTLASGSPCLASGASLALTSLGV